jgi:hypothetical protein
MARSGGKPAAEMDFLDSEEARAWFERQPREVCIALAVRSALRVLPLIEDRSRGRQDFALRVALPVLRACFVAWAIAEYPTRRNRLRIYADAAGYAAAAHAAAAAAAYSADAAAYSADAAAAHAVAVRADAVAIEQEGAVAEIVRAPLWPGEIPKWIVGAWDDLRTWMLVDDEANGWHPWVLWYNRVRDGEPSYGEAFALAVASLTSEQWNEEPRPAAVNRRISALLAEHTGRAAQPESETRTAPEAGPQTKPDPAASDARQSHEASRRTNSRPAARTARTTIGNALLERGEQVQLALITVIALIDEKLQQLNASPPNSDKARGEWTNEKNELEQLRRIVESLQADVASYLAGAKAEAEAVRSVRSFADGVEDYWSKNHAKVLEAGFNSVQTVFSVSVFLAALAACSAMGAGGTISTAICGALVGGKSVIEAVKAARGTRC